MGGGGRQPGAGGFGGSSECCPPATRRLCSGASILLLSDRIMKIRRESLRPQGLGGGGRSKMSLTKRLSLWSGPGTQQRGRWALEAPAPQPGRSLGRRPCSAGTHPPSSLPAPSKNPNRNRLCTDSSDSRWDPGVPSQGGWPGPRRPDGVCRGRAARLVQKRLSAPSSLPATRPSPHGREDTASPDSIKQVYSHFRKTNSRTGDCLPLGWV